MKIFPILRNRTQSRHKKKCISYSNRKRVSSGRGDTSLPPPFPANIVERNNQVLVERFAIRRGECQPTALGLNFTPWWHLPEHLQPLSVTTNWPFVLSIFGIGWLVGWLVDVFCFIFLKRVTAGHHFLLQTTDCWPTWPNSNRIVLPDIFHSICLTVRQNI